MPEPVISLITPPDKLFNANPSILLVNPSDDLKNNFNDTALGLKSSINLYLYEDDDITWLLDLVPAVNYIIVDIDNTHNNHWIIGHLLHFDKTYYLTSQPSSVYNRVNVNRIFEFKQFMEGVNYLEIQQRQ